MALHGSSTLELYSGIEIVFEANHASELGGALYATSAHQTVFVFPYRCFVSQHSVDFIIEDKWNTSLIFINNTALYGFSIYADPCVHAAGWWRCNQH